MNLYVIISIAVITFWIIPAIALTFKVKQHPQLDKDYKMHLIIPLWTAPLLGNLVCIFVFAKLGKLRKMTHSEHVSAASNMRRS